MRRDSSTKPIIRQAPHRPPSLHVLANFPLEGRTTEEMDVEMVNHLTSLLANIHDQTVAALGNTLLLGNLPGSEQEFAGQAFINLRQVSDGWNVLPGNDQEVSWRLRVDVAEGDDIRILVDDRGRYLTLGDPAEQAVGHGVVAGLAGVVAGSVGGPLPLVAAGALLNRLRSSATIFLASMIS